MTERQRAPPQTTRARISNPVSGRQCHLIIFWMFSWPILAYYILIVNPSNTAQGGGPRVVVSTAAFHARVRGSVPGLGGLKQTKNVSSPSTCESQYFGEPP